MSGPESREFSVFGSTPHEDIPTSQLDPHEIFETGFLKAKVDEFRRRTLSESGKYTLREFTSRYLRVDLPDWIRVAKTKLLATGKRSQSDVSLRDSMHDNQTFEFALQRSNVPFETGIEPGVQHAIESEALRSKARVSGSLFNARAVDRICIVTNYDFSVFVQLLISIVEAHHTMELSPPETIVTCTHSSDLFRRIRELHIDRREAEQFPESIRQKYFHKQAGGYSFPSEISRQLAVFQMNSSSLPVYGPFRLAVISMDLEHYHRQFAEDCLRSTCNQLSRTGVLVMAPNRSASLWSDDVLKELGLGDCEQPGIFRPLATSPSATETEWEQETIRNTEIRRLTLREIAPELVEHMAQDAAVVSRSGEVLHAFGRGNELFRQAWKDAPLLRDFVSDACRHREQFEPKQFEFYCEDEGAQVLYKFFVASLSTSAVPQAFLQIERVKVPIPGPASDNNCEEQEHAAALTAQINSLEHRVAQLTEQKKRAEQIREQIELVNQQLRERNITLAESAKDFESFLYTSESLAIVIDQNARIRRISPSLAAEFGVPFHETGRTVEPIAKHLNLDELVLHCQEVLANGKVIELEFAYKTNRWYELKILPIYRNKAIAGSVLQFVDISELKDANFELGKSIRRRDSLLTLLSHELRNPLQSIRTATQLLCSLQSSSANDFNGNDFNGRESSSNASEDPIQATRTEQAQALQVIDRQTEHMGNLLSDLLDVTRFVKGKILLKKRNIDLREVVGDSLESMKIILQNRKQTQSYEQPPESIPVLVDPTRIQQVVVNLISNASKYTRMNGHVAVRLFQTRESAIIEVEDNGIGIAESMQDEIFELFVQSNVASAASDKDEPVGIGVGLFLVKSLLELHGGSIQLSSGGIGKGSLFRVELPLDLQSAAASDIAILPECQSAIPTEDSNLSSSNVTTREVLPTVDATFRPAIDSHEKDASLAGQYSSLESNPCDATGIRRTKIAVVEDNESARGMIVRFLELSGFEVRAANDGQEGLQLLLDYQPDFAILDIDLPMVDGYQMASEYFATFSQSEGTNSSYSNPAVLIAVTGFDDEDSREKALKAGFQHYLAKPVDPSSIIATIERHIEEKR